MAEGGATTESRRADQLRRVRIGLTGLGGVVAAILVAGALVDSTANEIMANMTGNELSRANESAPGRSDPLSEVGAAPAAETPTANRVEEVPGTGATVDTVTGNVSDLPAKAVAR